MMFSHIRAQMFAQNGVFCAPLKGSSYVHNNTHILPSSSHSRMPPFTATKTQQLPHSLDTILPRSGLYTPSFSLNLFCHTLSAPITLILGGSISLTISVPICLNLSLNLSISVSSICNENYVYGWNIIFCYLQLCIKSCIAFGSQGKVWTNFNGQGTSTKPFSDANKHMDAKITASMP